MNDYDYTDVEAFFRDFQLESKNQPDPETKSQPLQASEPASIPEKESASVFTAGPDMENLKSPDSETPAKTKLSNKATRAGVPTSAKKRAPEIVRGARSSYSQSDVAPRRFTLLPLVCMVISTLLIVWLGINVHPASSTAIAETVKEEQSTNLLSGFNNFLVNAHNSALSDLAQIRMAYTIPEDALVAPKPDQSCYGETDDPSVVQAVVDSASLLLEGQTLVWNPDIQRMPGTTIKYYYDETILVITWKEGINGSAVTFSEIKIADGSQLRRAIAENTYGSGVQLYATEMAASANAVVAINGDFYTYRSQGITVYQRKLYRHSPKKIDTAYFTASGDMLFSHAGELEDEDEARRFIIDNDIIFSAAFGPILVEDGQLIRTDSYPLGEIDNIYSRSAIGQVDSLHYLLMIVGEEGSFGKRAQLNTAAGYIYDKGVKNAYALDGGQTAVLVMNNKTVNRVDWDAERTMSDIIYFATAIPSGEG